MDESAFSDINAHMAEGSAQGVEKHQIAGLKFVLVDGLGDRGLFFGVVRQDQAQGACVHGADKTAAIKTTDAGAAAFVGDTQKPHGVDHQFGGLVAHTLADLADF